MLEVVQRMRDGGGPVRREQPRTAYTVRGALGALIPLSAALAVTRPAAAVDVDPGAYADILGLRVDPRFLPPLGVFYNAKVA